MVEGEGEEGRGGGRGDERASMGTQARIRSNLKLLTDDSFLINLYHVGISSGPSHRDLWNMDLHLRGLSAATTTSWAQPLRSHPLASFMNMRAAYMFAHRRGPSCVPCSCGFGDI